MIMLITPIVVAGGSIWVLASVLIASPITVHTSEASMPQIAEASRLPLVASMAYPAVQVMWCVGGKFGSRNQKIREARLRKKGSQGLPLFWMIPRP